MCDDKAWNQADGKTVSVIYLSIGTEGRRIESSRNPHLLVYILIKTELWRLMEEALIGPTNITFGS